MIVATLALLAAIYVLLGVVAWKVLSHRARPAPPLNEAQRLMASFHRSSP